MRPKVETASLLASPDDTEAQFYEALQQGDIEKLMDVWCDDDDIVCVHPGGPRAVGWRAIRSTFEAIFANGPVPVQPEKIKRVLTTGSAVHNVLERVSVNAGTAWVIATNVYVKTPRGWRMAAHHASPGSASEPPELADSPSTLH